MFVMEGVILCVHLLILQQTVLPVTAQVTLQTEVTFVEGSAATFNCLLTAAWNAGTLRRWIGPGSVTIINNGASTNASKYTENVDSANNRFSMTIQNYGSGDEGSYQCLYGFDTSNTITLSISNTEVHPSSPPLDSVAIPDTTEAIALTISVPGIRPDASASFNLTSSTGTLKPAGTGSAVVTVTADGNGRTSSSSLKIDVPAGTTSTGDIFTITLVVGAYSETKQWTIAASSSSSSICDSCTTTNVLAALGLVVAVVCVALCWIMFFQRGEIIPLVYVQSNAPVTLTCPADDKATKLTWTGPGGIPFVTGTTVEAGLSGSVKRRISARHEGGSYTQTFTEFLPSDMGIYTSKVNGTVDSQMVILEGQTIITPVYVQSNAPVTLTCPADDKATKLTWTGPGGIPFVTGTTVEAGLSGSVKRRISARHTGGSYTLTFTKFLPSDMGIYTSEVDGIVVTQIVIVQECSVTWCFRETSIATVVSVIGFILCIAGLIICVTCDDSVSSSNSVTVGFALAVVGFVLAAVTLVIVIILVILFCCGVITIKDDGQIITHQVKSNDPLTLTHTANDMATTPTHPADDKATTLTWTGPGGTLYVTGTTVEDDLHHLVKSRISVRYTGGSYTLTFTEVLSSDMGIYTSTVNGTVVKHEVIVQE